MKLNITFSSLFALFMIFGSHAQTDTVSGNLVDQEFSELIENSNSYQNYKVVDQGKLTALQRSTANYISGLQQEISATEESLEQQEARIDELNAELENIQAQLQQVSAEKDAIVFLGMPISKIAYQSIMWGIVAILVLALVVFIYRFNKNNQQTKEAKRNLRETEEEFEAYRTKSLEKEQRLGRLLQDEKNKHSKLNK